MAEGVILKSASFEPSEEVREQHLEEVLEEAGLEVVEPEVSAEEEIPAEPEGDSAALARKEQTPRERQSRRERAIERATAPLLERIRQLEAEGPRRAQAEAVAPRPQRADFAHDEAYEDALVKWGNEKFAKEKSYEYTQDAQRRELERNVRQYSAQVQEAKKRYRDWDKVVNQSIYIGHEVQLAILEQENGSEVVYYLGRHPAYAAKLGEMSPLSAVMEVGRLSARLTGGVPSRDDDRRTSRPRIPAPVRHVDTSYSSTAPTFAEIAARPPYRGKAWDLKRAARG